MGHNGPETGASGVVEDFERKAKEGASEVAGNETFARAREAQQRKADARRGVATNEAKAEGARAEADAQDPGQRAKA